ncbi:PEP-CTERM domain protein [Desulfovibrio inopinatus]|uniref:PEP-CTERM domain protein n=1 Tax=Desulfovibrio inopinatus TaxID=102109 RepID=UPI0004094C8F|nr:PEP-CTERM domain protein [Desulfovibrio inopinatus]
MKIRHTVYQIPALVILCSMMFVGQAQAAYDIIDLSSFVSYGGSQDQGSASYDNTSGVLTLGTDTWKGFDISSLDFGDNSTLTFDFKASAESEIQGLGFGIGSSSTDVNSSNFKPYTYRLYGVQTNYGANTSYSYTGDGDWQTFSIDLSSLSTKDFDYLVFINDFDNDVKGGSAAEVAIRNVAIASTPIPGALWLFGSGMLGMIMVRRKIS